MNLLIQFETVGIEMRLRQSRAERRSLLLPQRPLRSGRDFDASLLARVVPESAPRRHAAQSVAR